MAWRALLEVWRNLSVPRGLVHEVVGRKVRAGGGEGVSGQAEEPAAGGYGAGSRSAMGVPDGGQACTPVPPNTEAGQWAQEGPGGRVASKGPHFLL